MSQSSLRLLEHATLIKQGAEAKVYVLNELFPEPEVYWPPSAEASSSKPAAPAAGSLIIKYRFPKTYRHPSLDKTLTRTRLSYEARALARCTKGGVVVPQVQLLDLENGLLGMERIEGWSIREVLGGGAAGDVEVEYFDEEAADGEDVPASVEDEQDVEEDTEGRRALQALEVSLEDLMTAIGTALAKLHQINIIHGDLTTSNMMVRLLPSQTPNYEVVLIDFGLSLTPTLPEHYAVDLYVLERAFSSTHPASEKLFAGILDAYAKKLGDKKWLPIKSRLEEVRLRGRKRDMSG